MTVRGLMKLMSWLTIVAFSFSGINTAFAGSRIIPAGKVTVYEGKKLVQVLNQESPFPNGSLLTTQGRCGARLDNLYLVAEDGATFGVFEALDRKDIRVDAGLVYFAFSPRIGNLVFLTPAGALSAVQIRLDASGSGGTLKGYLDVGDTQAQLGVLAGGTVLVSTPEGDKLVRSGKQITLAFVDLLPEDEKKEDQTKAEETEKRETSAVEDTRTEIPKIYLIGGGVLLTGGLLGIAGGGGGGGGSPPPVSPSSPTP